MIDSFDNEYAFLSNFYTCEVCYNNIVYQNSEAAFQAQKDLTRSTEFKYLLPGQAKRLGRKVMLRNDWDLVKDTIMYQIVKAKFTQNNDLKILLLETGNKELVEGNWWNDCYWGVCKGKGQNKLGKILMKVREELNFS